MFLFFFHILFRLCYPQYRPPNPLILVFALYGHTKWDGERAHVACRQVVRYLVAVGWNSVVLSY